MTAPGNRRRRVTLTFDNGPTPGVTNAVLDVLAVRELRASFCVVGTRLSDPAGAELARRTLADGHHLVKSFPHHACITIALLVALRAEGELAMHLRAALRNGLTPEEITEVILHTAAYAGIPAANAAMGVAKDVLRD